MKANCSKCGYEKSENIKSYTFCYRCGFCKAGDIEQESNHVYIQQLDENELKYRGFRSLKNLLERFDNDIKNKNVNKITIAIATYKVNETWYCKDLIQKVKFKHSHINEYLSKYKENLREHKINNLFNDK